MPTDVGIRVRPSSASDAVTFHTDQVTIDGVLALIERVKLSVGDPGAAVDVSAAHPLPTADSAAGTALASIEATLTSILGGEATQSTLAQLLTQLTTLTGANHTDLAAVLAKLSADPATQTTLAAVKTDADSLVTAMGGPGSGVGAITGSGSGVQGLLRMIWDTLKGALDISDRSARLLGHVTVDSGTLAVSAAGDVVGTLADSRKTVAVPGTAVALTTSSACKWVTVTALLTNTAQVNVGGSGVLATSGGSTGTPMNAGDTVTIPVSDPSKVFVDARVAGEGVSFTVGS